MREYKYKLAPHVTKQDLIDNCIIELVCHDSVCHETAYDYFHNDIDLYFFFDETREVHSFGLDHDIIKDLIDKGIVIEV